MGKIISNLIAHLCCSFAVWSWKNIVCFTLQMSQFRRKKLFATNKTFFLTLYWKHFCLCVFIINQVLALRVKSSFGKYNLWNWIKAYVSSVTSRPCFLPHWCKSQLEHWMTSLKNIYFSHFTKAENHMSHHVLLYLGAVLPLSDEVWHIQKESNSPWSSSIRFLFNIHCIENFWGKDSHNLKLMMEH